MEARSPSMVRGLLKQSATTRRCLRASKWTALLFSTSRGISRRVIVMPILSATMRIKPHHTDLGELRHLSLQSLHLASHECLRALSSLAISSLAISQLLCPAEEQFILPRITRDQTSSKAPKMRTFSWCCQRFKESSRRRQKRSRNGIEVRFPLGV